MGGQQSKPSTQNNNNTIIQVNTSLEQEQFYILFDVNKIKINPDLNDTKYFWIDPRIYNAQNQKNLGQFKQSKFNIQTFSSLQSLKNQLNDLDYNQLVKVISAASLQDQNYKYLTEERRILEVFLFCQNQQRAKLLMSNFPKIKNVGYTVKQIIQMIKKSTMNQSNQANKPNNNQNNVLFMTQQDTALMNKYRLNYHLLTTCHKNANKAKQHFLALAKQSFPNQKTQIQIYEKNFKLGLQQNQNRKQILQWTFKDSFYWDLVQKLPKMTTDPRKLAYIRHPIKDLFNAINSGYKLMTKKLQQLYIVIDINQQEKYKLMQNLQNFLIFTSFVKGYTDQDSANKQHKSRKNSYLFQIQFDKRGIDPELDFGYLIKQGQKGANVLLNIYNVFKLQQVTSAIRTGTLIYGALAKASFMRIQKDSRKKLKGKQSDLLRNYDYLADLMRRIKNQGNILQMSGYFKQSIELYNQKLQEITRTQKPIAILDQYKIQKAQSLKMNQQYQQAQKILLQVQSQKLKNVAKIRLIEIYFILPKKAQIQKLLIQLDPFIEKFIQWGMFDQYLKAKNYIGINLLQKQKYKEAIQLYKKLIEQANKKYQYRVQGIPLIHEIYRNLALSQTKRKNYDQAINLLKSSKQWQQSCQGRSSSLILTERMIQNAHHLKGDKQSEQQVKISIQKRKIQQSAIDINYLDTSRNILASKNCILQSLVAIDLNEKIQPLVMHEKIEQSVINIDFDTDSKIQKKPPTRQIIEQSTIDINI